VQAQVYSRPPSRISTLGFSYGWDGNITIGPDGRPHVGSYPTVKTVTAGSPAERAGLRPGDVVISLNGRDGREPPFPRVDAGSTVVLRIRRGDDERELSYVARSEPRPAGAGTAPPPAPPGQH
jgi:S1-C subfamily serine protease